MKYLPILAGGAGLVLLAGCQDEQTLQRHRDQSVVHLLTIDGCSVSRFSDRGRDVYVTICPQARANTQWTQSNGKNSSTHFDHATVRR